MKKILMIVALFGFGMMVGCGDDKPTTKTSGSTASSTQSSSTSSTPKDTK